MTKSHKAVKIRPVYYLNVKSFKSLGLFSTLPPVTIIISAMVPFSYNISHPLKVGAGLHLTLFDNGLMHTANQLMQLSIIISAIAPILQSYGRLYP
jgi:hypothetical protein